MKDKIEEFRAKYKQEFTDQKQTDNEVIFSTSASGDFRLETTFYHAESVGVFFNTRIFDNKTSEKIFDFNGAEDSFIYAWLQKGTVEYLACAEDIYGGQTIINLTERQMKSFSMKESGFIVLSYSLSPDGNKLATTGCYWACPLQIKVYDFSHPDILPFPEYFNAESKSQDEVFVEWVDNFTLKTKGIERVMEKIDEGNGSFSQKLIEEKPYERELNVLKNTFHKSDEISSMRDNTFWTNGSETMGIQVAIYPPKYDHLNDTWIGTFWLIGYGETSKDIFGASSIQAITLVLQQIKVRLMMLIEDGYTMCEKDESDVPTKIYTKRETIKNLNAVYGLGVIGDKAHTEEWCLQAIERLQEATGTEEEQDRDIKFLRANLADPKIIDYIFHHQPELSAEEILVKALAYRSIQL